MIACSTDNSASAQKKQEEEDCIVLWITNSTDPPGCSPLPAPRNEDGNTAQRILVLAHYDSVKSCHLGNVSQFPW